LDQDLVLSRCVQDKIAQLSKIHNMLMTQISMTYICYMIYRQNIVLKRFIFQQVRTEEMCKNFWHLYASVKKDPTSEERAP